MTWPWLTVLGVLAWALLTVGLLMLTESWATVPLSAGSVLAVLFVVFIRAQMAEEMKNTEADK